MLVALAITVLVGVVVATVTVAVESLRIADEYKVAVLVCISGAVAGWALVGTVLGVGTSAFEASDALGALAGSALIAGFAWRGRRRTFDELGLTAHSAPDAQQQAEQPRQLV